MVRFSLVSYFLLAIFCSCQSNPEDVLKRARLKMKNSNYIAYTHSGIFPVPTGKIDTTSGTVQLRRRENAYLDFDFIGTDQTVDVVYIKDDYKLISHEDSVITVYTEEDLKKREYLFKYNSRLEFGSERLLREGKWKFVKDTIISGQEFFNYYLVDMDTVVGDKKIDLEKHIFINTGTALMERYATRLYHDGKEAQFIICTFSDFDLRKEPVELTYYNPRHYVSKMASEKEKLYLLKEGQEAPDFVVKDMDGITIQLSQFKGQKVLLNFSMIHCGWCKIALDEFNKEDFDFAEGITALYINPVDSKEDMVKYLEKFNVPFPVIAEAESIGKSYGVSGYPTFYLIDEKGVIEKVFAGFQEEIINSLR